MKTPAISTGDASGFESSCSPSKDRVGGSQWNGGRSGPTCNPDSSNSWETLMQVFLVVQQPKLSGLNSNYSNSYCSWFCGLFRWFFSQLVDWLGGSYWSMKGGWCLLLAGMTGVIRPYISCHPKRARQGKTCCLSIFQVN